MSIEELCEYKSLSQKVNATDADDALAKTCCLLSLNPNIVIRGSIVKEIVNYTIVMSDPQRCVIINKHRKLSVKYLAAELLWYFDGDLSVEKIVLYASMWSKLADKDGNVASNYGYLVFKQDIPHMHGLNQFCWAFDQLCNDKNSRQSLINFNQVHHKSNLKDFVCTINAQFFIRNNKLIMITNMRSNDIIYGFCYDFPFFSFLHQLMFCVLKGTYEDLQLGSYIHNVASMHIYKRHFDMMIDIVNSYDSSNKKQSSELPEITTVEADTIFRDVSFNGDIHIFKFIKALEAMRDFA